MKPKRGQSLFAAAINDCNNELRGGDCDENLCGHGLTSFVNNYSGVDLSLRELKNGRNVS
jgi:hypothetical protein